MIISVAVTVDVWTVVTTRVVAVVVTVEGGRVVSTRTGVRVVVLAWVGSVVVEVDVESVIVW